MCKLDIVSTPAPGGHGLFMFALNELFVQRAPAVYHAKNEGDHTEENEI